MKSDPRISTGRYALFLLVPLLWSAFLSPAAASARSELLDKYSVLQTDLDSTAYGIPLVVESVQQEGFAGGTAYGVINHPFTLFQRFDRVQVWCDVVFLHMNVKACVHEEGEPPKIIIFSGRKFYQPPEKAYRLEKHFRVADSDDEHIRVELSADEGPMGTKDYRIVLEATPLDGERTFLAFSYSYSFGPMARLALKTYLATLGQDKNGITVENTTPNGKPQYVQGFRGMMERNAIRYYYAVQAYLDTLAPIAREDNQNFSRLEHWFDLTDRHPQLRELSKEEYLSAKTQELANQKNLQHNWGRL